MMSNTITTVMSRMAAKFEDAPTSTSSSMSTSTSSTDAAPSSGKVSKMKKFCTRGEEFYDFLKSLGYHQSSKYQKPEHFEYLFQDEKSASFVKMMMSTLKTKNCLLQEELERYEGLKKQGFVMYGANLEEAITRRRAINDMFSKQDYKKQALKETLEKELEAGTQHVEQLRVLETVFQKEVALIEAKQTKVTNVLGVVQRLLENSGKDVDIDLKLLNEKMEELDQNLQQMKNNLLPKSGPDNSGSENLCQIDARRLIEKEENLFGIIQEMTRKHGANLIIKEAGYGIEGDPLNAENIGKIFSQYEKEFHCLKHSLIYERVNQVQNEVTLAGRQGFSDKFQECCDKANQLAALDYDTRAKQQMQQRDNINNITSALQSENEHLLECVRASALQAINKQFSALTDIKARSKKKLLEFFTLVTDNLRAQKVRVTVIRNLIKSEGNLYSQLLNNIEENIKASSMHIKKLNSTHSKVVSELTDEGRLLSFLFKNMGIPQPSNILTSTSKVHNVAQKILSATDASYWNSMEDKNTQVRKSVRQLCKTHEVTKNLLAAVNDPLKNDPNIAEMEERVKSSKEELLNIQQTKATQVKERLKLRESNLERMKALLHSNNTSLNQTPARQLN
ncbi:HAUS augmin-like complex subunit 3 [Orchesella cincta]|uniref:HAUS augmin-like complex subunit 3 n=1 Tax=Orchesella cincta TaxID=48709 RepID=A0A1D2MRP1_ORCCI|nr:HAUS augmin-like complex subunit 3 [Orchesella cincta]